MLKGKGLLTPIQRAFIKVFTEFPDSAYFYLTGGTALAEFYFGHRLSFDLDFFTREEGLVLPASRALEEILHKEGWTKKVVRRFTTYVEFDLEKEKEELRVELAFDAPFHFEEPVPSEYGIKINAYKDLIVEKTLAFYGPAELLDVVDLYVVLQKEGLEDLLQWAKQKDPGFDLYWFAVALRKVEAFPDSLSEWPVKLLCPLDPKDLKDEFQAIAMKIMHRIVG